MFTDLEFHNDVRRKSAQFFYEITGIEQFHVTTHAGVGAPMVHIHIASHVEEHYPGGREALQAVGRRVASSLVAHYRLIHDIHINNPGVSIIVRYPPHHEYPAR